MKLKKITRKQRGVSGNKFQPEQSKYQNSQRDDNYCYDLAAKLYEKYGSEIFDNIFDNF